MNAAQEVVRKYENIVSSAKVRKNEGFAKNRKTQCTMGTRTDTVQHRKGAGQNE